ncbi:MAG: hypothetical protein WA687_05085 [Solirubrobacterales bacterium]
MKAGTFDARLDRYVTWSIISLDKRGWANVTAGIDALAECLLEEGVHARNRAAKSDQKPVLMTVGLGAFEAPKGSAKAS